MIARIFYRVFLLASFLQVMAVIALAADKVVLKNYDVKEGKIEKITDKTLYLIQDGKKVLIDKERIAKIVYEDGSELNLHKGEKKEKVEKVEEVHHQHSGFFFRYTGGMAYQELFPENENLKSYSRDKAFLSTNLQFGGSLMENFPVYFTFGVDFPYQYKSLYNNEDDKDYTVLPLFVKFGLGFSYYFMPSNYYIDLHVGKSQLNVSVDDSKYSDVLYFVSGLGNYVQVTFGKEFWASENWGIGLGVYFSYYSLPEAGQSDLDEVGKEFVYSTGKVDSFAIGILFSATYN